MNNYQKFHTKRDWENKDITAINREEAHSPWGAYESFEQAKSCDRLASKWVDSLDGSWRFLYCDTPLTAGEFYCEDYDRSGWSDITVPGNWEVQGFGKPIYTNVMMPWNQHPHEKHILHATADSGWGMPNPPYIPEENPTGLYYRTFNIPAEWLERDIFIHFKGVETAYYLWINGREVGYSQDSKLPSEFNITPYIKAGENSVALQVMRFADSTHLEDQDYWYLSGIYRSVYLYAKPKTRITDFKIDALPEGGNGVVAADVRVNPFDGLAEYKIRLDITDMAGNILASGESNVNPSADYRDDWKPTAHTARVRLTVENVGLWTPETPTLYKAIMTLIAPNGEAADFESCRIGFKRVEISNGIIYLNGKRLIVRGVNRHEHEARHGRAVPVSHMIEEIKTMKRLNINSVRTCHYPDDPIWYDLCDEWGILLICECNIETHALGGALTHNPAWATNFLERAVRMVLTHKNHASVYSWSLGNESGTGANHAAMAGWIREYDKTRLCQYEAGGPGKNISDIRGNMYATQNSIMSMLTDPYDTRPIVLVEYLYQICNAGGGMHKFRQLTERYQRFQGGYIWDWQDKALINKTADGEEYYAYGGDFGEGITDGTPFMTNNGIVLPDLTVKPAGLEAKYVYCPIIFEKIDRDNPWVLDGGYGKYILKNRNLVTDTSPYHVVYTLRENGCPIKSGEYSLPYLPAGGQTEICFDEEFSRKPNCEYTVEFSVRLREETAYSSADYEIGCYQFELESGEIAPLIKAIPEGEVALTETADGYTVAGSDFEVSFGKMSGEITYSKNGKAYLTGVKECITRPYCGVVAQPYWGRYQLWDMTDDRNTDSKLVAITAENIGNSRALVEVAREVSFKDKTYKALINIRYTVNALGEIEVSADFTLPKALQDIPRVGLELVIPEGHEAITYYGYGPTETYRDRMEAAKLGVFDSTVAGEHFPFCPPSENGGHEQTRWLTLTDGDCALKISSSKPFHFDVHHSTVADYKAAKHDREIIHRPESYLHIDAAHAGIGSDMGWSTMLAEEDRVKAGNYSLCFTISAK